MIEFHVKLYNLISTSRMQQETIKHKQIEINIVIESITIFISICLCFIVSCCKYRTQVKLLRLIVIQLSKRKHTHARANSSPSEIFCSWNQRPKRARAYGKAIIQYESGPDKTRDFH